ncbi:MAG: hypothetical protein J0L84_00835 [Verrucomicrobia bacterium]|nr:hypothetical protein [Verrucomicrobiota bacterium]
MPSPIHQRRRFLMLSGISALPVLLVLGLGIQAVRREQAMARLTLREDAAVLATGAVGAIRAALTQIPVPSRADVEAFQARPAGAAADPSLRLAREQDGALARFVSGTWTHPPESTLPGARPSQRLDRNALPAALVSSWQDAVAVQGDRAAAPEARVRAWSTALEAGAGSPAEGVLRLHTARALMESGQTGPAANLFRSIALASSEWPTETGLPLRFLALRGWLQVASIDPAARPGPNEPGPLDWLGHWAWVRRSLPTHLLEEWRPDQASALDAWKNLAAHHDRIRSVFASLGTTPPEVDVLWMQDPEPGLLSRHPAADGTWWVFRDLDCLRRSANRALQSVRMPPYLTASVAIGDRSLLAVPDDPAVVGSATDNSPDQLQVRIHLSHPDRFAESVAARSRRIALLAGAAVLLTGMASIAILMAYRRQQQLAELQTDFVASVTHELRAPLAAVRLIAEELTDLPESERTRRSEYHGLILREARRLGRLIENVLRHARLERNSQTLERSPVDLRDVLKATSESLQPAATERDVCLRLQLPDAPVNARVDPQALQQVLGNLVDNALKHAPPHSDIECSLEARLEPRPMAAISVTDHGPGIPSGDHRRIFEPFFRRGTELRRETSGIGLGLTIARRLVSAHDGTLEVRSEPGRGARFTVTLPLS